MNIQEMHVWFRQYAQQMGMQNVRAILPEQIDSLIYTSTLDTIDEVINRSVGLTNDRVITDNSKLANINALRTLHKVESISLGTDTVSSYKNRPIKLRTENLFIVGNPLYYVDFSINYTNNEYFKYVANEEFKFRNGYTRYLSKEFDDTYFLDLLKGICDRTIPLYHDCTGVEWTEETSEDYDTVQNGVKYLINLFDSIKESITLSKWFPVRVIDDAYLADVLNDWILSPRMRTPAMVVYGDNRNQKDSVFEVYVGENDSEELENIAKTYSPAQLRCSYIKQPNKVRYLQDIGGTNVNSDLPEQLHIPMLKHAVDLYRMSITGSAYASQQSDQQAQQELARNNARPTNEGYQS